MTTDHLLVVLKQILPLMSGYAYLLNKEGVFITCTRSQAILFGLTAPEDINNKTSKSLPAFQNNPELLVSWDAINQQMIKNETSVDCEEPIKDAEGNLIVLKYHKMPLFNDKDHFIGLLSVAIDETINNFHSKLTNSNDC